MKFSKVLFFFFLLFNFNLAQAENVYFVDIDYLLNKSKAGTEIIKEINKDKKKKTTEYDKIGTNLRSEEEKILMQKNILSKVDYEEQVSKFKIKATDLRKKRNNDIQIILKKSTNLTNLLLTEINKIISEYATDNAIPLVIQKKHIIIGKTDLDLTKIILELLDKNIKKVKIN